MIIIQGIKKIVKGEVPLIDAWYWLQGTYRAYGFYYHKFGDQMPEYNTPSRKVVWYLMRSHIKSQLSYRVLSVPYECYFSGSCKLCGCKTPDLFCADKSCDNECYPSMLNKRKWNKFVKPFGSTFHIAYKKDKTIYVVYHNKGTGKFVKVYKTVKDGTN